MESPALQKSFLKKSRRDDLFALSVGACSRLMQRGGLRRGEPDAGSSDAVVAASGNAALLEGATCDGGHSQELPRCPRRHTETVTRKNVAGMEVMSLRELLFCALTRSSSCLCRSAMRPLFSAASKAFMVGP